MSKLRPLTEEERTEWSDTFRAWVNRPVEPEGEDDD